MVGSIGGIVSGMDTHSIVSQLLQLERMPQNRLQSQRAGLERVLTALRSLNTKVSAVGDAVKAMNGASGWSLAKGVSSDTGRVAVSASAGATPATLTFAVTSLATAASAVSAGTVPSLTTAVAGGPLLLTQGTAALGLSSLTAGASLAPGSHTVTVTQASAPAVRTAATQPAATTTITTAGGGADLGNDALQLTVGGVPRLVTLAPGSYDRQQLAAELTRALGGGVTASLGADGALTLRTTAEGSTASLQVVGGTALAALGFEPDVAATTGTDARLRLGADAATEVSVTDVRAGLQVTLTDADGSSVVATLSGGLRAGDARLQSVDLAEGATLAEVVKGINGSGTGVVAAAVQVSPGAYRLQLSSATTGAASGIAVDASFLAGLGGMQVLSQGTDAVLTVGTGPNAYDITRTSNTITDLFRGVTLTLAKADPATQVTVDVLRDRDGLAGQASKVVDALNAALTEIGTLTRYDPETKKAGLLVGDGMLRRIRSSLLDAVTGQLSVVSAVDGSRLTASSVGVELKRDGSVAFDKAVFLEAYAKDPAAVEALLGKGTEAAPGIAGRLEGAVQRVADRTDGLLQGAIKSKESQIRGFTERISSWDTRLRLRELTLQRQFTAMEKALGAAQQQGQWLAGQIAGLPSWGDR